HTAASAEEAFRILGLDDTPERESNVEVILMDIMMPGMDGIAACRRIKASERFRDIPIIMVTAQAEVQDLKAAFAAGAMDYIQKPINIVELVVRLRSALRLKHEMDWRKKREQELLQVTRDLAKANEELKR